MSIETWRKDALAHSLWLLEAAGQEYALEAADAAERRSEGVLVGLGARVRRTIEEQRAASLKRAKGGRDAR